MGAADTVIWVFPKIGVGPQNGWIYKFIMENPWKTLLKWDDLGTVPLLDGNIHLPSLGTSASWGCDQLFERHPEIIHKLNSDAPNLLRTLLDGLVWRSRLILNGQRRATWQKTKQTYSNMLGLDLTQFIDMGSKIELENCASLPWCFVKQPFYRAFFPANGRPTSRLTITWSIWYKMLMVVLIKGWNGSSKDSWCSRGV